MKPELWPVIHVTDQTRALEDVKMVVDAGCDGVWLIQMHGMDWMLYPLLKEIRETISSTFPVGVNFLSMTPFGALSESLKLGFDATWADSCGVHSTGCSDTAYLLSALLAVNPNHKFFGSVAFKYQRAEPDPRAAALLASQHGFIPTTSGSATGSPPTATKLSQMFDVTKGKLAVASGVDYDNVSDLAPYMSHIFVATSISNEFDRLDRDKLLDLKAVIDKL